MDLELRDQVVLVAGGASGIGAAIAAAFVREGCRTAILDVDPRTPEIAKSLAPGSGDVIGVVQDVTQYAPLCEAVRAIVGRWGGCHHVVFAAGAGSGKYGYPFWNLEPADWPRVWQVNLLGAVHLLHACGESLRQNAPSTALLLSSVAGQIGSQTDPPYSAAKAALINFAQCAAKDFAPYNVRVNTICPGMIKTPLNRAVWQAWRDQAPEHAGVSYQQWAEDKIRRTVPLGRWQTAEDVAELAVFLASPRAANITGQTWNVDGGQVMQG